MRVHASENDRLLTSADLGRLFSPAQIRGAVARGDLVRVRRGSFVYRVVWEAADAGDRHILRMRAVAADCARRPVFAGDSAGVLWALPRDRVLDLVSVLGTPDDRGGPRQGVRRITRGAQTAPVVGLHGLAVTSLARTALDMAAIRGFSAAVSVVDAALSRHRPDAADKTELFALVQSTAWPASVVRVVEFATHLSDSPGESEARAQIHLLGFPAPVLQQEFFDAEGRMRVDFFWPEAGVVAEFDGRVKYTREEFTGGDPAAVVWREKRREDRLRRQVRTVVRFSTAEVRRPALLRALLLAAGVRLAAGPPGSARAAGERATGSRAASGGASDSRATAAASRRGPPAPPRRMPQPVSSPADRLVR